MRTVFIKDVYWIASVGLDVQAFHNMNQIKLERLVVLRCNIYFKGLGTARNSIRYFQNNRILNMVKKR